VLPGYPPQAVERGAAGDGDEASPGRSGSSVVGAGRQATLVVVDKRRLDDVEVRGLRRLGHVVAIDARGAGREACDYLIDILPRLDRASANVRDLRLLELDTRAGAVQGKTPRVLVTFGGDDPRGLTQATVVRLLEIGRFEAGEIEVLAPALQDGVGPATLPDGVRLLGGPVDLPELLGRYSHVVTSFGLTALEAVWAGAEVILVNASRYHERLARRAGFRTAGVGRPRRAALERRLRDGGGAGAVRRRLSGAESVSLSGEVVDLEAPSVHSCPACGDTTGSVAGRFPRRTYIRCSRCGMLYLESFDAERDYTEDYFFEEYRRQYGRTYLEDADHIRRMGHARLDRIIQRVPRAGRLLDVGCAYGPFMTAAAERGFTVCGVDASEAAVRYVRETLGFEAHGLLLEDLADGKVRPTGLEDGAMDVVTMWFVIEHLPRLKSALTTVAGLLREGGVFAFSTPNAVGVSGRSRFRRFLEQSPRDHFTIWSPAVARRVLREHGFVVKRIRVTGHHPVRFPVLGAAAARSSVVAGLLHGISRLCRLGDTFEVYAVKKSQEIDQKGGAQ
jgi:2-polyprenyl-3-methyl-5-hydroxy-6-metoxy-1,4-benzoquinol methylase